MPNIIEKFVEINNGFTILISGPLNKKVKKLAKHVSKKFGFSYVNSLHFTGKKKMLFTEHDSLMDWDMLNREIGKKSKTGVVVSGYNLPKDKLTVTVDYHIHLSVSRTFYVSYRNSRLSDADSSNNLDKLFTDRFYQYSKTVDNMKINKFIKIDTLSSRDTYEKTFDLIVSYVDFKVYKK